VDNTTASLTTLTYAVTTGVARIHLNRPGSSNAIDVAMARDLRVAATECAADATVRALLITGAGARFCAGGDITMFAETPRAELPGLLDGLISDYHVALTTLADLDVPIVCAVQRAAAGGGLGLLYAADIVIASDDAKFAVGYGGIGLSADGGNSWYLPRLVGPRVAAQMFLENRVLTAGEALTFGLVSELVPAARLAEQAEATAARLATGPTQAFALMRRLLRDTWTSELAGHLHSERAAMVQAAQTDDAAEGIAAFTGKRRPDFTGR
jgi:2-(1,2-epoxy-1,2-dihydrophenyl)acetyl-CoA isomerase